MVDKPTVVVFIDYKKIKENVSFSNDSPKLLYRSF